MTAPIITTRQTTRQLFARLFRDHIRHYRGYLLLAVLAMMVAAGATAGFAKLIEPILDDIFIAKNAAALWPIALAVVGVFVLRGLANYAEAVCMSHTGQGIIRDLQNRMFRHVIGADLQFFQSQPVGSLVSRFTFDVQMLRAAVSNTITGVGKDVFTLIFLAGVLLYQDASLALVAIVVFPLTAWPITRVGRRVRKIAGSTQDAAGDFTSFLEQIFYGARQVKANLGEARANERARDAAEELFTLSQRSQRYRALTSPLMEFIGALAIAAVVVYGGQQVILGNKTTGEFFSFITALILAYEPLKNLAKLNATLQEGMAAAQRIYDFLAYQPRIVDSPLARPLRLVAGEIEFRDVVFGYGQGQNVLRGINLKIPARKTVALVGPSGGGKSTILNLLPRFYDIQSGQIFIDGQEVRALTLFSLRQSMALVAQETLLFDDTVWANIIYSKPDASMAEVEAAARAAEAHDFIQSLPDGYQTVVGPNGSKLSGGQRQRIAIARAMLKNAPILLLDEATSALDSQTEQQVQAALQQLMAGRTTLVIAHRLSTITQADWIYVIGQGQVIEQGTHAQLLAQNGSYAELYRLQQQQPDAGV
jgi:ATP-binding cassette, subfamily B, bacterial MsbA